MDKEKKTEIKAYGMPELQIKKNVEKLRKDMGKGMLKYQLKKKDSTSKKNKEERYREFNFIEKLMLDYLFILIIFFIVLGFLIGKMYN